MRALRKQLMDLDDREALLFRALASEWEQLSEDIAAEASVEKVDFRALAAANRDRRLVVELLRQFNLPPLSCYCSGPDEATENLLMREADC